MESCCARENNFQLKSLMPKILKTIKTLPTKLPRSVWAVALLALTLRVVGSWWGLPLPINVDEPALVSAGLGVKHNLNPGHFEVAHLVIYLTAGAFGVFYVLRTILETFLQLPEFWHSTAAFFLVNRLLIASLGTATVIPVYLLGKKIYNHKVGLIAALFLAVTPIHLDESHLAKFDVALTFFTALAFLFAYQAYTSHKLKDYLIAGAAIGFATSAKYHGVFTALFLAVGAAAHFWQHRVRPALRSDLLPAKGDLIFQRGVALINRAYPYLRNLTLAGLTSVVTFFIGTPFALLDYQTFLSSSSPEGMIWQHRTNLGHLPPQELANKVIGLFFYFLRIDWGWAIWGLFILAVLLFIFFNRRRKADTLLTLPTLAILLYMTRFRRSPPHYFIFLLPVITIIAAEMLVDLQTKWLKKIPLFVLAGVFLIEPLALSLQLDLAYALPDTRNLAYNWIQENLGPEDYLYLIGHEFRTVVYKNENVERIEKLDEEFIEQERLPFYVIVGQEGIDREQLLTGKRDPVELSGNSSRILETAELLFYTSDQYRFGPPIFIFKVSEIHR